MKGIATIVTNRSNKSVCKILFDGNCHQVLLLCNVTNKNHKQLLSQWYGGVIIINNNYFQSELDYIKQFNKRSDTDWRTVDQPSLQQVIDKTASGIE